MKLIQLILAAASPYLVGSCPADVTEGFDQIRIDRIVGKCDEFREKRLGNIDEAIKKQNFELPFIRKARVGRTKSGKMERTARGTVFPTVLDKREAIRESEEEIERLTKLRKAVEDRKEFSFPILIKPSVGECGRPIFKEFLVVQVIPDKGMLARITTLDGEEMFFISGLDTSKAVDGKVYKFGDDVVFDVPSNHTYQTANGSNTVLHLEAIPSSVVRDVKKVYAELGAN